MPEYQTIPIDLVELAEMAEDFFRGQGFAISREKQDLAFPATPAMLCRRTPTRLLVDVSTKFEEKRLAAWAGYAKSSSTDTQIAVVTNDGSKVMAKVAWLRANKIGLFAKQGVGIAEILPPQDLAILMELPDLRRAKPQTRKALGPAFEQINRGLWREGFETACQALEKVARRHIRGSIESTRLQFRNDKGKILKVTIAQVEKRTLGQLSVLMNQASPMNAVDGMLAKALPLINKERVDVAHKKYVREAALRKHVGNRIWVIFNTLQKI